MAKLYISLNNSQPNTAISCILSQNDIVFVYLFFIISTIFICFQGNIGATISELPTYMVIFVVHSLSHVWLFATPWTAARQASLSFTISQSLLKLTSIESVMLSYHPIVCCPLLFLPSMFPSIRVFCNESVLYIMWPKYWSFSFSISPSNEYLGLTAFRIDWFDILAFQGTLKCLLQHQTCSN